jgi:hypothetical protein
MERILRSGMTGDAPLPAIPGMGAAGAQASDGRRQRRFRR